MHPGGTKQWSKVKFGVESFFAPSVAGRVELRYTRYRGAHDQTGRGYITVDGKEVWNMCSLKFMSEEYQRIQAHREATGESPRDSQIAVGSNLLNEGILAEWDFFRGLQRYMNSSIEENIASESPLIRSLAMLDRRFGKRRLVEFDTSGEHTMVRYFHAFRCAAESIKCAQQGAEPDAGNASATSSSGSGAG